MVSLVESDPSIEMVTGKLFGNDESRQVQAKLSLWQSNPRVHSSGRDPLSGLPVVRCDLLKDWISKVVGFDGEVELNQYAVSRRYSIMEIPIVYRNRGG